MVFSWYSPRSGIAGSYGSALSFSFSFWGKYIVFFIVVVAIYIPTNSVKSCLLSTPSLAFIICRHFDDGHSDWRKVIPYYSFTCISLIISDAENFFSFAFWPSLCLLWKKVYLCLLPTFWLCFLSLSIFFFFGIELHELFVYFGD